MRNLCTFCGKVVEKPELKEDEEGKKVALVRLSLPRTINGKESEEFIEFTARNKMAENIVQIVNKDDVLAVRGNIITNSVDIMGTNINKLEVVPKQISYLDKKKVTDDIYISSAILIGRLVKTPELMETESGKSVTNITLAVPKEEKNEEGVYETDFINVSAWNGSAKTVSEYCRKGDLIAITGSFYSKKNEYKDIEYDTLNISANKISFLSTKRYDEGPEKEEKTTKNKKTKDKKESEIEVA